MPSVNSLSAPAAILPLQGEGRTREPVVEQQIRRMAGLTPKALLRAARVTDKSSPEFVREETLVYLLRDYARKGNNSDAGDIVEVLVERCAGFLAGKIAPWKSFSEAQKRDCINDIYSQMWEDLFNLGAGCEFWEIRFWLCLDRRCMNRIQSYRAINDREQSLQPYDDADGAGEEPLERIAAPNGVSTDTLIMMREALAQLPDKELKVFTLYYRHEYTQEEIARILKITDRTVRNILMRAEKILTAWRAGIEVYG